MARASTSQDGNTGPPYGPDKVAVRSDEEAQPSSTHYDLEKLGRQRPEAFASAFAEIFFCFSLLASTFMAEFFVSGFNIILPAVSVALDIPADARTWPSSVFSLVTGSFLLPFGRLADMYGGYLLYVSGLVWFLVWCLISGFSQNYQMLIVTRALAGLGPAAFLPASIMLLGKTYRPGPRKNLIFGLYGAFAPLGFFFGIVIAGVAAEYMTWRWFFFLGTIVLAIVCVTSFVIIPRDKGEAGDQGVKMDYLGMVTIVPALLLVVFAITDGAHAPDGWRTPYIIVTFVVGLLLLATAVYVEGWVASQPLLPFDLFKPKYMIRLNVSLFFAYGAFGVFLLYASFYIQDVMGASPILTAAWFAPMAAGGIVLATIGGFTLHLLPGSILLIISGLGSLTMMLLFAFMPEDTGPRTYFAFVFPAMIGATLGVDIAYNVSNVYITTNVPRRRQGVAGAVINSLLFLGISFFLGLADLAVAENQSRGLKESYRIAFWFGTACAGVSLLIFCFIKIGKAKSQLLIEEREEMGHILGE
ncbi:MFS general substrate transporter [Coniochaeta ligniaria NRRL 30616]|uniref:MFS general substrate transporter n=1 Tax=Coniochaeta ligniaria NRRL 30616 TaxID=1408157 RepID=A0A1J7J248_9PEZI|nr:MFS general substrate transporter [Coniochaeta ligniaria NRRL 30616]